jgi:hypothetical protein
LREGLNIFPDKAQIRGFYILTAIFGLFLTYGMMQGMTFLAGLPLVFIILMLMVFRLDLIVFAAVLITPFSINLAQTSIGIGVSLPSEPLMFGLFVIFG